MRQALRRTKSALSRRRDAVIHTMSSPALPFFTKLHFIRHGLWLRSRTTGSYRLRFAQGTIRLSYADNETDRNVVWDVFVNRCYGSDFHDATVVDIGAHKGYFGAYALMHGAKQVVSYEPERQNFGFLTQTAQSFAGRAGNWETRRSAVTARSGEVTLRVDPSSWAHSIAAEPSSLTGDSNTQVVSGTAMTEVLASSSESRAGKRLVVKIDAEGAECEIVLQTSVESWRSVDEVFLEFHDFAPCTRSAIIDHLEGAGLVLVDEAFGVLHLSRSSD